jgi:hypothetical protein
MEMFPNIALSPDAYEQIHSKQVQKILSLAKSSDSTTPRDSVTLVTISTQASNKLDSSSQTAGMRDRDPFAISSPVVKEVR